MYLTDIESFLPTKWRMFMPLKRYSMIIAATTIGVVLGATSASAQENCGNLYNRVMSSYQTYGPQSQEYARISNYYSARCLSGSSTAPTSAYPYQTPYAYQRPGRTGYGVSRRHRRRCRG